jgi:hypothetical protein
VNARRPDDAQRNPGTTKKLETLTPDYAALHPGYKIPSYKEKGSGTPADAW